MNYQQYRPSSFNILPVVVKNLLIINGIMLLAETVFEKQLGFSFNQTMGLYYPLSEYFKPWQYITHLFLHGSFIHLLFNMWLLWMLGNTLENYWGSKRFLVYYLVTGIGAAIIHNLSVGYEVMQLSNEIASYANAPNVDDFIILMKQHLMYVPADTLGQINQFINSWEMMPGNNAMGEESVQWANLLVTQKMNIPVIGASGAVYGVLLAFGMLFPNSIIYLYFAIPIKAKYLVIILGLIELYAGFASNPGDNVAHFAHLGGMLFGFFLIRYWNRSKRDHFY